MGIRRQSAQRKGDEPDEIAHRRTTGLEPGAGTIEGRLIELQQTAGNSAVTTAIQRRATAASTDAPGAKKGKKTAPKKDVGKKTYWPKERKFPGASTQALVERAQQDMKSTVKNDWISAKDRFEDVFLMTSGLDYARFIAQLWGKLGDTARKEFWEDVFHKKIKPFEEYPPPGSLVHL